MHWLLDEHLPGPSFHPALTCYGHSHDGKAGEVADLTLLSCNSVSLLPQLVQRLKSLLGAQPPARTCMAGGLWDCIALLRYHTVTRRC